MAIAADAFREGLSRWASGVTIVTSSAGGRIHGMTVSAFSGVSLDPPLVLVCADLASNTHPLIAEGGVFAVNVLASDQTALASRFASKQDEWRRFEGVEWRAGATGAPLLAGSLAAFDCRVASAHAAGDHVIYVGRVEAVQLDGEREPLLYFARAYGGFRKL